MAQLPQKVINGFVYAMDQNNAFLGVASVDLPTLENVTDSLKGLGMAGETTVPIIGHFNDMSVNIHFQTMTADAYKLADQRPRQIEVRSSIQVENTGANAFKPIPVRYVFNTYPKSEKLGKIEVGQSQDMEVELTVVTYAMYYDRKRVKLIDKYNMICEIDGEDVLAEVRDQLGIS